MLVTRSICEALSYDSRLVPLAVLADVEAPLVDSIHALVNFVAGMELVYSSWTTAQLPGPLGGLGLRLPGDRWCSAYLATAMGPSKRAVSVAEALGRPIKQHDETDALQVRRQLDEEGIKVLGTGEAEFTDETDAKYAGSPWARDITAYDLLSSPMLCGSGSSPTSGAKQASRIQKGVDSLNAVHVHEALDSVGQTAVLSAGGLGVGKFWTHIPTQRSDCVDNACFRLMMLIRLDALRLPEGLLCSMPKSDADESCDKEWCTAPVGSRGLHLYNCQVGGSRFRPHRAVLRCGLHCW